MTRDQVLGIVRHVLTFAGGIIIAVGWADNDTWTQIAGAVPTLIGAVWSIVDKATA